MTDEIVLARLEEISTITTYRKGQLLQKASKVQANAAFLIKGVARAFYLSGKGEEITDCFLCQFGYPVMTADVTQPSFMSCEAVTDLEVLEIPLQDMLELASENTQVLWAYNQMLHTALLFHWQIKSSRFCFGAKERYLWFKKTFPGVESVAKGVHVASFLGITPETLSRIRKIQNEIGVPPIMIDAEYNRSSDEQLVAMYSGFFFR